MCSGSFHVDFASPVEACDIPNTQHEERLQADRATVTLDLLRHRGWQAAEDDVVSVVLGGLPNAFENIDSLQGDPWAVSLQRNAAAAAAVPSPPALQEFNAVANSMFPTGVLPTRLPNGEVT